MLTDFSTPRPETGMTMTAGTTIGDTIETVGKNAKRMSTSRSEGSKCATTSDPDTADLGCEWTWNIASRLACFGSCLIDFQKCGFQAVLVLLEGRRSNRLILQ
jgi:hypothetical protein